MNHRTTYGLIAIIALGLFIIWSAGRDKVEETQPLPEADPSVIARKGTVTEVDLEEMMADGPARIMFDASDGSVHTIAIPSMGRPLCAADKEIASPHLIAPGDYIEVEGTLDDTGAIVPCERSSDYVRVQGNVSDTELGLTFTYRKGPDGYVMETIPENLSADPAFKKGYIFTLESDYAELQNATAPREGPPTLQVRAYENTANEWATIWPERHPRESNIELALGESEDLVIGGANAVKYTADGLYPTDTYVVANGSYMFVFTGAYIDDSSPQRGDLEEMLKSVTFIPEE